MKKTCLLSLSFHLLFGVIKGQNQSNVVQYFTNTIVNRKALVEHYTGHKCGNCPAATDTSEYLENLHFGDVTIINVHAGFFANVNTTIYPTDFRTQVGNDWDSSFGISAAGNPNGLVNRAGYGTGGFIKAYSTWESEVSGIITQPAIAEISISPNYNLSNRLLSTDIKTKFFGASIANYKLIAVLTEDGVIAEQLDYRMPSGSQLITTYVHNNVLRESMFGSWGILLNTMPIAVNDSVIKSISNFNVSPNYNDNNLDIVAFVYDTLTFEVMQVENIAVHSTVTRIDDKAEEFSFSISPNPSNSNLLIS